MWLAASVFWTPKAGNSSEEYEDAFWPHEDAEWNTDFFRYAIADGATQTSFSGIWAELLVRSFCKGQLSRSRLPKALSSLQQKWQNQVSKKPLPWFAQEKVRQGAFATVLGLTLSHQDPSRLQGEWSALAIGDSCVFQIRNNRLLVSFPFQQSSDFNNSPALLSSNPLANSDLNNFLQNLSGDWEPGDLFFLMTDALACWFLLKLEQQENPIELLCAISSQEDFLQLVDSQRLLTDADGHKVLKNDDITLFRIYVS